MAASQVHKVLVKLAPTGKLPLRVTVKQVLMARLAHKVMVKVHTDNSLVLMGKGLTELAQMAQPSERLVLLLAQVSQHRVLADHMATVQQLMALALRRWVLRRLMAQRLTAQMSWVHNYQTDNM
jgi:hypothetical protein